MSKLKGESKPEEKSDNPRKTHLRRYESPTQRQRKPYKGRIYCSRPLGSADDELNNKQELFVRSYLNNNLNVAKASEESGYERKYCYMLLEKPNVQRRLRELLKPIVRKYDITSERVLAELAAVGFCNMDEVLDFVTGDFKKNVDGRIISSIKYTPQKDNLDKKEVKLHDKLGALKMMGDYLGLFKGEPPVDMKANDVALRAARREMFSRYWDVPIRDGLLKIKTKEQTLITFEPNKTQTKLNNLIMKLEKKGEPVRIIVLKARQEGVTTDVEAVIYCKTAWGSHTNSMIIADLAAHSTNIFEMFKRYHKNVTQEDVTETALNNAKVIDFSENDSKITVGCADNVDTANSMTIHNFHGSEVALWKKGEELMFNTMQAIPFLPNTMAILESTARGANTYFHRMVKAAESNSNGWVLFFAPWYDHDEYSLPIPADYDMTLLADGKWGNEIEEQYQYGLTLEQMYWRRLCITRNCNGNLKRFRQDYPGNIDEAFIASGYPVFDLLKLSSIEKENTELPIMTAIWDADKIKPIDDGYIQFWAQPAINRKGYKWDDRYVIFADTGGTWEGADYSCADVYDRVERKLVCQVHAHMDAYKYADLLNYLGRYYHDALLAVEMNRWASETDEQGQTVIDYLSNKLNYPNLFMREVSDNVSGQIVNKYGYHMNASTKQMVVDRLIRFVKEWQADPIKLPDYQTYNEMKSFVILETPGGKTTWGAALDRDQEGFTLKDDRVIAWGGCLEVSGRMPQPKERKLIDDEIPEDGRIF